MDKTPILCAFKSLFGIFLSTTLHLRISSFVELSNLLFALGGLYRLLLLRFEWNWLTDPFFVIHFLQCHSIETLGIGPKSKLFINMQWSLANEMERGMRILFRKQIWILFNYSILLSTHSVLWFFSNFIAVVNRHFKSHSKQKRIVRTSAHIYLLKCPIHAPWE